MCMSCHTFITVEHVLLHCIEYNDIRAKYFDSNSLKELLSIDKLSKVIAFLREAGLYYSF